MKLNELFQCIDEGLLTEVASKRVKVVRKGRVIKKRVCPDGYKLEGKKCVRQKAKERLARRRGAIRGNKKSKSMRKLSRKRSLRVRHRRGL